MRMKKNGNWLPARHLKTRSIYFLLSVAAVFVVSTSLFKWRYNDGFLSLRDVFFSFKDEFLNSSKPLILFWNPPYHAGSWPYVPSTLLCGGGCDVTVNRRYLEKSDALVFYMKAADSLDLPRKRRPDQLFVWWSHESPFTVMHYYKKSLDDFDGYFNVTMHYRSDADITASFIPHTARDWYLHKVGRKAESTLEELPLVTSEEEFERMFDELMKVKSGGTSWVASDCNDVAGATKRLQLVNEIEKKGNYVIDRYGRCGIREIPLNGSILYDLLRTYRFYLAFENAQSCKDYISEKFWYNALYTGAVPIVWGPTKADVERVAPPNSFIHVDDFDGDWTRLANYLRSLEADVDAYKEYFRWWTMKGFFPIYKLRQPDDVRDIVTDNACHFETNGMCHLCKTLNENRHKKSYKVVRSLSDHFYGPEIFRCFKPNIC